MATEMEVVVWGPNIVVEPIQGIDVQDTPIGEINKILDSIGWPRLELLTDGRGGGTRRASFVAYSMSSRSARPDHNGDTVYFPAKYVADCIITIFNRCNFEGGAVVEDERTDCKYTIVKPDRDSYLCSRTLESGTLLLKSE